MNMSKTLRVLLLMAALCLFASSASATIVFDGSPGTNAPPGTLGAYTMMPFGDDGRSLFANETTVPSPISGDVAFNTAVSHRKIGQGWGTWSHGYTGDVYYTNGATSITMTLPANTGAFYFYAEPNPFETYTMTAVADDGTTSGPVNVNGASGARYFGFHVTGGMSLVTVTISSQTDFAIGEFGIAELSDQHLPVELASFNVSSRNSDVFLSWRTASEVHNAGFEVQRAGMDSSFTTISSYVSNQNLTGLGTTSYGKSYNFVDGGDGALVAGQTYLYRLVDVSTDGVREEHPVVAVKIEATQEIIEAGRMKMYSAAPNPAVQFTQVPFSLPETANVRMELYSADGRRVAVPVEASFTAGDHAETISLEGLSAGSYTLVMTSGYQVRTQQVVVVR
jgi:hypothetical protein